MAEAVQERQKGILGLIERAGNKLPDPVFIFFWLIGFLIVGSAIAAALGYSAQHPTQLNEDGTPVIITAASMLSPENIQRLWVDMPETFTHFHPLGYVLVVMLGAGVAERSGLFAAAMRAGVKDAPKFLLTPAVAFVGMMGNLAADAAYPARRRALRRRRAPPRRGHRRGLRRRLRRLLRQSAAGPIGCASVRHYRSSRRTSRADVGRQHRRQLVLYRCNAGRIPAGDLVCHRRHHRAASKEIQHARRRSAAEPRRCECPPFCWREQRP
jgi:hypothetical protein